MCTEMNNLTVKGAALSDPNSLSLIAYDESTAIGYLVGAVIPPESYRVPFKMAELENMYVEESYRGKGVGRSLVNNFEKIKVIASAGNTNAIKFYESKGCSKINVTLEKDLQ